MDVESLATTTAALLSLRGAEAFVEASAQDAAKALPGFVTKLRDRLFQSVNAPDRLVLEGVIEGTVEPAAAVPTILPYFRDQEFAAAVRAMIEEELTQTARRTQDIVNEVAGDIHKQVNFNASVRIAGDLNI